MINNIATNPTTTTIIINQTPQQANTITNAPINCFETDSFTQLIPILKRLQDQQALPLCIINVNQYPNAKIINEMIERLFSSLKEQNINLFILSSLLNGSNLTDACKYLNQQLSNMQVMQFAQLTLYKVLPCPNGENCEHLPREIATNNQYYDRELSCPFYHHYRDQRRICINDKLKDEFMYQANYFDEEKPVGVKENYSQNYFESMFHPLYYKMFQCARKYCKAAPFCPFYHTEEEKKIWGDYFLQYINKERVAYVKEKKKNGNNSSEDSLNSLSPKSESEKIMYPRNEFIKSHRYELRNTNGRYNNRHAGMININNHGQMNVYYGERYENETTMNNYSTSSKNTSKAKSLYKRMIKEIKVI